MEVKDSKMPESSYGADIGATGTLADGRIVMRICGERLVILSGKDTGDTMGCLSMKMTVRKYQLEEIV